MKESMLYFECYAGISGDMTVSALLDLGVEQDYLLKALDSLDLEGYEIKISRVKKSGIDACFFQVLLDSEKESPVEPQHTHPHETPFQAFPPFPSGLSQELTLDKTPSPSHFYNEKQVKALQRPLVDESTEKVHHHCHSHECTHDHGHSHNHGHAHDHGHTHNHEHSHNHGHAHDYRNLQDVLEIIKNSGITAKAKKIATEMFHTIARAEGKAHGLPMDEVHFHEVGAVDSIVDFVAVAVCLDYLNIDKICVSTVYEGSGFVKCQHGLMPIPVPAVVNIAAEQGISLRITDTLGEMVTPTGMAIVATMENAQRPKEYTIQRIGIGAGQKDFPHANILRIMEIQEESSIPTTQEEILQLETNVDDSTGEALGFTMDLLLRQGAKDVFFTPIFMKKNRPAVMLTVLCDLSQQGEMEDLIFTNLSTIGIRSSLRQRTVLQRELKEVETSFGKITVKCCTHQGKITAYPEYEDVKKLCLEKHLPFQEMYQRIQEEVREAFQ